MSSWIGHALGALLISAPLRKEGLGRLELGVVALSILPDVIDLAILPAPHPDESHSIAAVVALGLLAWLCSPWWAPSGRSLSPRVLGVCLLAAGSHLVLDLLANPPAYLLAWPWSEQRYGLSHGMLPAAPALSLSSFYFYRNILLECAIFVPPWVLSHARWRAAPALALGALCSLLGLFVSTTMIR
jgi:hypothetical protein